MKIKIKDMQVADRPREKLIRYGHESLSDDELLAIIISTGTNEKNAIELAREILDTFSDFELIDMEVEELKKVRGIKEAKASKIVASLQLGRRIKERLLNKKYDIINSNVDVYNLMKNQVELLDKEHFYIILLDTKNKVIGVKLISIGDLNSSIVNPREVFKPAIKLSAKSIILVHNHPSGNPQPSKADILVTHRIVDAGDILDIKVLDHVIIGFNNYFSLKKENYI